MTEQALARIVHISTAHSAADNRIFRKECVSLAEAGFDVHLIAIADGPTQEAGVQIWPLPRRTRWRRMLMSPWDVWKLVRALRPDLIHVHDPELIALAVLWSRLGRGPAVYDAHEDLPKQVLSKPYIGKRMRPLVAKFAAALEGWADRSLSAVVAATPSIARNYRRAPVALVQNFPWTRDFPETAPLASAGRAAYIGGVSEIRGVKEMIAATTFHPSFEIIMAGPIAAPAIEQAVSNAPSIDYRGVLPASQMGALLGEASVGLVLFHPLPNHLEAQPTKLFEYMASGRPFVASDFPSWRALLGSYDCGLFVDPLDPVAIHRAVTSLLGDQPLATRMGERGRAALLDNFCFEAQSSVLVTMVEGLLDGGPAGRGRRPDSQE